MPAGVTLLLAATQIAYLSCLLVTLWLYSHRVDVVDASSAAPALAAAPEIIVLYPVLRELEATMRTSMLGFERAGYPPHRRRVVAIPNSDDLDTIASLRQLATEYPFLEILCVPPTDDLRWAPVWEAWSANPKAYWWHTGRRKRVRALPAKKTRQLVYALYTLAARDPDALLSYIDADSIVPADYFVSAAAGMQRYDVLQCTNVAGNALATVATSMFAMDHMLWDGSLYQHMSAGGAHPYYVLGKGLFFRVGDLLALGGFNPWLTIEDPEVGMRLWANGRRLGIIRSPLIEEVPDTFAKGITQRKRWIAGFFQSLASPLKLMGMTPMQRVRARMNLVPCASLSLNPLGVSVGAWALVADLTSPVRVVAVWLEIICLTSIALALLVIAIGQRAAWRQTGLIYVSARERIGFMLRVNPLATFVYWVWWSIPLAIGFWMYLTDRGQTWERTEKIDANHDLARDEQIPVLVEAQTHAGSLTRTRSD